MAAVPDTVTVSLVQGRRVRLNKFDEYTHYKPGIQKMPRAHAEVLGVLNRVVSDASDDVAEESKPSTVEDVFDEKLANLLTEAGYKTLDDLKGLSRDQLLAINGVGPMAYERITRALKGVR